ncbi:MAG: hypothetical protein H0T92_18555 [Pyrinomonadaceae bacterium]|nr:hypothetical protein [Pyrinomonadaceae bacterium]
MPPVRDVVPYKPGKRQSTFRRLNLQFSGTALEEAIEQRDKSARDRAASIDANKTELSVDSKDTSSAKRETTPVSTAATTPVDTPVIPIETSFPSSYLNADFSRKDEVSDDLHLQEAAPVDTPADTPVVTGVASDSQNAFSGGNLTYESPSENLATDPGLDNNLFGASHSREVGKDQQAFVSRALKNEGRTNEDDFVLTEPLDATHSGSEQKIYSVMYRETISKNGNRERHFGFKELSKRTGIRSDYTIRKAIDGLIDKRSIEIVRYTHGNPLGPRYRIYKPREIEQRRRSACIVIDLQSKKIVKAESSPHLTEEYQQYGSTPVRTPVSTSVATGGKNYGGTPANSTGVTPANIAGDIKYINRGLGREAPATSSLSKSSGEDTDEDSAYLEAIRDVYERVTGNTWTTADTITAQRAQEVPVELWGIAICYCVDRAPNHKFDRLAYVLEEARRHYEEMSKFSKSDLQVILKHSIRVIQRARGSGIWEPRAPETST